MLRAAPRLTSHAFFRPKLAFVQNADYVAVISDVHPAPLGRAVSEILGLPSPLSGIAAQHSSAAYGRSAEVDGLPRSTVFFLVDALWPRDQQSYDAHLRAARAAGQCWAAATEC